MDNIYYQDESGFDEYYTRRYGYAPVGKKINLEISGKRYERQSVMAVRSNEHKLVEPMIYQGTADSNTVYAYFENLCPSTPSLIFPSKKRAIVFSPFSKKYIIIRYKNFMMQK